MSSKVSNAKYFPFFSILALIFITLKLTGHIAWSWLWVLSPLWLPISLLIGIFLLGCIILGICKGCVALYVVLKRKNKKEARLHFDPRIK